MSKRYRVHRSILVKTEEEAKKILELTSDLRRCILTPEFNNKYGRNYNGMYEICYTCYEADFESLIVGLKLKKTHEYGSGIYIFENESV